MARLRLSDVPLKSVFSDKEKSSQWLVVAHDADGDGITTLIMFGAYYKGYAYDAQEPNNPDTNAQKYGNVSYEYSNILQWLNSDKTADKWYEPQHENDAAPAYATNYNGFLCNFTEGFRDALASVEKAGISRKVHIPAVNEMFTSISAGSNFDTGISYGTYSIYRQSQIIDVDVLARPATNLTSAFIPTLHLSSGSKVSARTADFYPYNYRGQVIPMIFMRSNTPVTYSSSDSLYYGNYDNAPVITVNTDLGQHKSEFSFTFAVSDADDDTVSVKAYVDDDSDNPIFNSTVSLDTDTSVTVPSSVMGGLEYGNHTVSIIADDGDKTTTATSTFEKYDIAPTITVQPDMGQKKYTFNFSFQVSDTDDMKSAVTVKLDNKQIYSNDNAPINEDITVQIATADFNALSYDTHTLTITASDGVKTGTATAIFQRIEISAPVITADEIGNKADAFSTTYQVSSETADSINVVVKLDNAEIDNKTNVSQNTDITLSVSASRFNSLNYGEHTIAITATDNDGYSSTRTLVFKKCSIPTVRINGNIGQVDSPFSVEVVANSADGGAVTVKAYIDGQEIEQ